MSTIIRAAAPAKLNLYLHVLGRRADGYHLLDSLVAFAELADTVEVRPSKGFSLMIDGPFAAALAAEDPERNLVARAARLMADALGRSPDVAIRLTKRLPVAGGIGGGSSDAAATLRALSVLWGLAPDDPRPTVVAPRLGADVPVCLVGRTAYFGGIGDMIDPAPPLPHTGLLLVNPGVAQPTKNVFAARTGPYGTPGRLDAVPADARTFAEALRARRNDLAAPAATLAPVIDAVVSAIAATPDCLIARMSGSGATCFGLYPTRAAAEQAASLVRDRSRDWWVAVGTLSDAAATVERG